MGRAIILLMDSFGIGGAPDAAEFDNLGADTFGHIAKFYGHLDIPNLNHLGLCEAAKGACGTYPEIGAQRDSIMLLGHKYGHMVEISRDKDTVSGHWEITGLPNLNGWGHFPPQYPSFPTDLIDNICRQGNIPGILGNRAASGTVIIQELGEEHIASGKPIFYTSADSNLQIAAHEQHFGLERLYKLCETAYELVKPYNIGRIIARPFIGEKAGSFTRTANRRDYTALPFGDTLLDKLKSAGKNVIAVGAINDIFAHRGITREVHGSGLKDLWDLTLTEIKNAPDDSLIFTNFEDFDMLWGHRRDIKGYARGLEYFDSRLSEIMLYLHPDDIVFITADHGNDPSYKGTDHTREQVPVIMFGKKVKTENIGRRDTYADLGQTIADYFGLTPLPYGKSFL